KPLTRLTKKKTSPMQDFAGIPPRMNGRCGSTDPKKRHIGLSLTYGTKWTKNGKNHSSLTNGLFQACNIILTSRLTAKIVKTSRKGDTKGVYVILKRKTEASKFVVVMVEPQTSCSSRRFRSCL